MATMSKPFTPLATNIEAVRSSLEVIAKNINADTETTDEGKAKAWTRQTVQHRDFVERIEEVFTDIEERLTNDYDKAKAKQMPVAQSDTEQLVVEMQLQRVLSRGDLNTATDVHAWVTEHEASPLRTTLIQEFEQRGVLDQKLIDGMVASDAPEVDKARTALVEFGRIQSSFKMNLGTLKENLDNRYKGWGYWVPAQVMSGLDLEVPGTVIVPVWTATQAETLYRAR